MLFDASLRKELGRSFVGTLIVLLTVVITLMLIRTLGQASKGSVSPSDIMLVMGYTVLGYLPIVLSLSMFVAIIGTLARMYQDSEMVIWFASGLGIARLLRPLARFAWPLLVAIAALSLLGWPWSQAQILELRYQFQQRSDIDRVAPGEFQVSSSGDSVFFVDRDSSTLESARQIFLATEEADKSAVTTARQARLDHRADGQTWAVLEQGQRVEQLRAPDPGVRVSEFERYEVQLQRDPVGSPGATVRSTPTLSLLEQSADNANAAELVWRLGLVFAAINYVVLALALTSANPRSSRMGHIVTALLVFVVYFNLLTLGQSWVGRGKVSAPALLALLHGGILLLALVWLMARHYQWSPRRLFKRGVAA
ncbi:LPS export ABC transporter permease LptF [Corticibacter populi]|uniref:Lipopolysaccharide export system permease protein LptF n=1 Tax=Corticibacter populi TaxID=1550736 RepID=A0A3M6QSM3_9BURK|nr:LPS export ABC transporter permease LptF [Corticibacter populi]RMX05993.1 LPS export ABC transporter permease LptF [Corticibacter populi]RZS30676.1 lipopolysaccharide export system permease protein [Corticibacter populi]